MKLKVFSFFLVVIVFGFFVTAHAEEGTPQTESEIESQEMEPQDLKYQPKKSRIFHYELIDDAIKDLKEEQKKDEWPQIDDGPKVVKGARELRVGQLRARLLASGELLKKINKEDFDLFDDDLETALKVFQKNHGLNEDGVLGKNTVKALNISIEKRITQLEKNKKRLEDLPLSLSGRYILANLPDYRLRVVDDDQDTLVMRVIVGQRSKAHRTPLLNEELSYIVLNPRWHVPKSIAVKEMLPKLQNDPAYLSRQNIKVIQTIDGQTQTLDSTAIDWSQVDSSTFDFRFSQDPGDGNALGHIKFIFPNKYNVYLHDTNNRSLFQNDVRDLSHGCVRVEKPLDLAKTVLKELPEWTEEKIKSHYGKGGEKVVTLPTKIPVHIVYVTAWIDDDGVTQFRDDIYGYDAVKP